MVDLESAWIEIGSVGGTIENSDERSFNHSASKQVMIRAISSDSMVLLAINVCLQDFQDIVAPPNMNTYPVVDFTLLESMTQLTSLYPSITSGYPM